MFIWYVYFYELQGVNTKIFQYKTTIKNKLSKKIFDKKAIVGEMIKFN